MPANTTYYTRNIDDMNDQYSPMLNGRHQLDYDYNGSLDEDTDPADCYRILKGVRVA